MANELVKTGEVDVSTRHEQHYQDSKIGDYRFLVMESFLSYENDLAFWRNILMKSYFNLKYLGVKESINFGLDPSNVTIEKYPVVVSSFQHPPLIRQ